MGMPPLPIRHELVHESIKPGVMVPFVEMNEFVHKDHIDAACRHMYEFEIQPDSFIADIAAAPARLHSFDPDEVDPDTDFFAPMRQTSREIVLKCDPQLLRDRLVQLGLTQGIRTREDLYRSIFDQRLIPFGIGMNTDEVILIEQTDG